MKRETYHHVMAIFDYLLALVTFIAGMYFGFRDQYAAGAFYLLLCIICDRAGNYYTAKAKRVVEVRLSAPEVRWTPATLAKTLSDQVRRQPPSKGIVS